MNRIHPIDNNNNPVIQQPTTCQISILSDNNNQPDEEVHSVFVEFESENNTAPETTADRFAKAYDLVVTNMNPVWLTFLIDFACYFCLLIKLLWLTFHPYIIRREQKRGVSRPLGFLGLLGMLIIGLAIWPLTYHSKVRRYRGIFTSFILHLSYTTVNILLLSIWDHNFAYILLFDIPLFIHSILIFTWQNYSSHIEGSNHKRFIANAFFTRPVQHIVPIIYMMLEYVDVYQGYYTYSSHVQSKRLVRSLYLVFAAINSYSIPLAFSLSTTIGAATPHDFPMKDFCCGFFYDTRRNFAINSIDFATDVPIIILKTIDRVTIWHGGWIKITLFAFSCVMCVKSLVLMMMGIILLFLWGCENDCIECCHVIGRFHCGGRTVEELRQLMKTFSARKFILLFPCLPCMLVLHLIQSQNLTTGKQHSSSAIDLSNMTVTTIDCKQVKLNDSSAI